MAIHLHDQRHPVKTLVNKPVPATRKHGGGDGQQGAVTCSASQQEAYRHPTEPPANQHR